MDLLAVLYSFTHEKAIHKMSPYLKKESDEMH
jgi:hypothetical protein